MKTASMNHAYRLVWNEQTGSYVPVAETTRARGKRASRALLATALLGLALQAQALEGQALPSGGKVVAGQAQIGSQGGQMNVQQQSQKLILSWDSFDIGAQAGVRFDQPNASSVVLNRVLGTTGSQIEGQLTANGQVWLVNPNGVVFGKGAQVNVGGLVASSLGVSDADFLAGKARFSGDSSAGTVSNAGHLQAGQGVVALIAPVVSNSGNIAAGQVALGAGQKVALDFAQDGLLQLVVDQAALDAAIENSGRIQGGNVLLSARSASSLRASVINNEGVIEASGLSQQGGRILLDGGDTGTVHVAGRLDASSATAQGGAIGITGQHLQLDGGAQLDASGASGGGQIHVGGGYQGKDSTLANAQTVSADASVSATANATQSGKGGEVVFWSDGQTRFAGRIEVKGGSAGGDGGRAEVSGKQELHYSGRTDATAAKGRTGDLLLDPSTITVSGGSGNGDISGSNVYEKDLEAQQANVLLNATGNITFTDLNLNGGDGKISMANNVSLRIETGGTDGVISFQNAANTLEVFGTGSIMMVAGGKGSGTINNVPNLIAHGSGSNPATLPTHNVLQPGSGTPGDASITLFGADGVTVGGSLTTNGGYVRIWADSDAMTGGGFTLSAPVNTHGGNLYVASGTSGIDLNSTITLGTGRLSFDNENAAYIASGNTPPNAEKRLSGVISVSGDVTVDTPFTMNAGASILTDGVIRFSNTVNLNTGNGVLTLRGSGIDFSGATLQNLSTASMRLEPADPATNMVLGDANGFASAATLAKLPGIKNLTIGRSDGTGTVSVPGNFSFSASGSFEIVNKNIDISSGTLTNTSGNITLTGDNISISQAVTATGANPTVTLRQMTASNALHLGSGLSNSSIGQINANTLVIGRSDGGDVVFDSDISSSASTVHLMSAGQVIGSAGGIAASNLAISAGGGAQLSSSTFNFSTLALDVGADSSIERSGNTALALGSVDGVSGLNVRAGSNAHVTVGNAGSLSLNAPINFNGNTSTLSLQSGQGFDASGASVSNQGNATVEFSKPGAAGSFTVGGSTADLNAASLGKFGGVNNISIQGGSQAVSLDAFSVGVGGKVQVLGQTVTQTGAQTLTQGGLSIEAQQGGLNIGHDISAAGTLALTADANQAIQGSGTLSATQLALRNGSGAVTLNSSSHAVQQIAADVGSLSFTNGGSLTVGSADGLSGVHAQRTVSLQAQGAASDLTLNTTVHADNQGTQATPLVLAAGRNFINNAGASALLAGGSGRWLVYSTTPANDQRGGLAYQFKQYDATQASTVLGSGDGFLYSVAPTVSVALTGTTSKVYDGGTQASLSQANYQSAGTLDGDSIAYTVGGQAQYADKNVGNGKTVSVSGIALNGASNGAAQVYGYQLSNTSASGAIGNITPKVLTLANLAAATKVYDGTTQATVSGGLQGVVGSESVNVSLSGQFADKNAGTAKAVQVNAQLGGADQGNYVLASNGSAQTQGTITPKTLTVSGYSVSDKVYDGSRGASVNGGQLQGMIAGDTHLALSLNGQFADKNAGSNKLVNVSGSLSGSDAGNYQLAAASLVGHADITPKTIGATVVAQDKVYDGSTTAQASVTLQGVLGADQLQAQQQSSFSDKNVGAGKTVSTTLSLGGADAGNYQLAQTQASSSASITPRDLSVQNLQVADKVYDGGRTATVQGQLANAVVGDALVLTLGGQFDTKNVGTGKSVAVQAQLAGADAGNYRFQGQNLSASGSITPKAIDVSGVSVASKVYDGTRTAGVSVNGLQGLVAGDQVQGQASGQFDTKNAGSGKQVAVSLTLGGADAGNYVLAHGTTGATGSITPKSIDVTGVSVASKVYDGSRTAGVSVNGLQGLVAGDQVQGQASGQFDTKNAGNGKQVAVSLSIGGADAGNYVLAHATTSGTGSITPKTLNAGPAGVVDKVYDGTSGATLNLPTLQGTVAGDQVQLGGSGSYDNASVGYGKPVSVQLGLQGADAGNYQLQGAQQQTQGAITPPASSNASASLVIKPVSGNSTQGSMAGGNGNGNAGATAGGSAAAGQNGGAGAGLLSLAAADTSGSASNRADAGASAAADGTGAGRGDGANRAGSGLAAAGSELLLRNGAQLSLALDGPALDKPVEAVMPVFEQAGVQALTQRAQYRVSDLGDSLALLPLAGGTAGLPGLDQAVSHRAETLVDLGGGDSARLRLELLGDGTLRALMPLKAAVLGHEALSAYSLSTIKRQAGIALSQVRAIVLRFDSAS